MTHLWIHILYSDIQLLLHSDNKAFKSKIIDNDINKGDNDVKYIYPSEAIINFPKSYENTKIDYRDSQDDEIDFIEKFVVKEYCKDSKYK